ncbi:MAG: putative MPP superfamily phosphohydrolase [Cryomorphaceae bacterium]|jgi:predicted MPP superfamily phosphohydrolase
MKNYLPLIIFIAILLVIDLYAFKSVRLISSEWTKPIWRNGAQIAYWIISVTAYGVLIYAVTTYREAQARMEYYFFFMGFGLLMLIFMPKLIAALFHLTDDILHIFRRITAYFVRSFVPTETAASSTSSINRWQFISRIGWALAAIPFFSILYGIGRGRYRFRTEKVNLAFDHLPKSFEGFKIVHISDIHIGSFFNNYGAVQRGVDMVNALEPDLILFTGDMVNNYADEVKGWENVLGGLKAKHGKYSIFGNHDYGDYVQWESEVEKKANLDKLADYHEKMGFKLLTNEWTELKSNSGEVIEIIGMENWGLGGFSKYGDLAKSTAGTDPKRFQILMSHDPSHWDAEVMKKTDIDLTLAGHTHGMQFGIEIPGWIKWSPVKYRYPRWGGLYTEGKQHLYVNRGFGYLGFPGRIGMPPEITLIELNS